MLRSILAVSSRSILAPRLNLLARSRIPSAQNFHRNILLNKPLIAASFSSISKQLEIPEKIAHLSDLLHSLPTNPENVSEIVDAANLLINQEKIEECLQLYQTALFFLPNSASLNCRLGTVCLQFDDYAGALPLIAKGLEIDPLEMGDGGLIGLASLYKFQNNDDKAIETYLKSIELGQLPSYSHAFIALLYAQKDNYDAAEHHQAMSRSINPNDFASEWAYGELIFTKDQERGIKILKEAAENLMNKKCDNLFMSEEEVSELIIASNFRVGQIFQHILKDLQQANTFYLAVLNKNPNHVESHVQYASCLKKISPDNEKLAQEHLDKAKSIDPTKFEKKLTEMWQQ